MCGRLFAFKLRLLASLLAFFALHATTFGAESRPTRDSHLRVREGQMAPDFTLRDQGGNKVSLSHFRGKQNVIVAFYVFAFTKG
jgi:cytochrome oxidase Cu insertion factor (SCO1/SenC/PrrC family)